METGTFKKIVNDFLKENDFKKNGNNYLRIEQEVICAIGLQKSNFSNIYYINVGFVLRSLRPELLKPKSNEGDIRFRFSSCNLTLSPDGFELDSIDEKQGSEILLCLNRNFNESINGHLSISGLKQLIERDPNLFYRASLYAKHFFNLIEP